MCKNATNIPRLVDKKIPNYRFIYYCSSSGNGIDFVCTNFLI